jgi:4-hydroxy-tetrahydrodipicolinate synthase
MVRRHRAGDVEAARTIDRELEPAYDLLKVVVNPIAVKAALGMIGWEVGGLRLPLVEATDDEKAQIREALERGGVLETASV